MKPPEDSGDDKDSQDKTPGEGDGNNGGDIPGEDDNNSGDIPGDGKDDNSSDGGNSGTGGDSNDGGNGGTGGNNSGGSNAGGNDDGTDESRNDSEGNPGSDTPGGDGTSDSGNSGDNGEVTSGGAEASGGSESSNGAGGVDGDESPAVENNGDTRSADGGADQDGGTGTDAPEISDSADNRTTAGFSIETGAFVMPVYASENLQSGLTAGTLTDGGDDTGRAAAPADGTGAADQTDTQPQTETGGTNAQADTREKVVTIGNVTWQSAPAYDGSVEGTYTFTAVLPEGYALSEGVSLPQITVTAGDSIDAVIQTLLDRIAALPDAQEYLEKEPDIDNWEGDEEDYEEAYAEWMEGLQDYAKEALAILEEIGKLTEEEQALLPQEALEKLAAWEEIAKTLSENTMVMAAADGSHGTHAGWTQMTSSTTTLTAGKYYLIGDVTVSQEIQVTGREVTLCLNGHALRHSTFEDGTKWVITVAAGATLNVYDCADGGKGTIESAPYYNTHTGGGISVAGTLNVYGGVINGNNSSQIDLATLANGAGVCARSGSVVNLHGGTVQGINASGVHVASGGKLTMDDEAATVICQATKAAKCSVGGIYIENGAEAKIDNGTVSLDSDKNNNSVILVSPGGSLRISRGVISQQKSSGAIAIGKMHYHNVSDNKPAEVEISGGTVSTYVFVSSGMSLKVSGGSIAGASLFGGVLEMSGNQELLAFNDSYFAGADISISADTRDYAVEKNATGKVRLTGALTNTKPYVVHLSELNPSSTYPLIITEGFGAHMSGQDPAKYFTSNQGYKVILKDGEAALRPYIMTFNANGGTCATTTKDFQSGTSLGTLPAPTKEHYTFDGWYTAQTGGEQITTDTELSGEDKTVYAHWTPVAYNITYNLDGGALKSGETNPATYHIETPAFTLKNPVRAGYVFTGWGGTGLTGQTNKTVQVKKGSTGDRAYTAHWEEAKYQVTVNIYKDGALWSNGAPAVKLTADNGGSFITDLSAVGDGDYKVYSNNTDTGVNVTVNGGNATAQVDYYTVTFYDGNTAYTNPAPQTVLKGKTATKPSNPSKTGYTFQKWVTADGGSTEFGFNAQIKAKTPVYASWTANSYTVTYNGNGNTGGSTANSTHTYDTAQNLTANGYERKYTVTFDHNDTEGNRTTKTAAYTFDRWNTKADGSGTDYNDNASVKNLTGTNGTTVTLYARWTPASVSYTPTRAGYTFEGWYTDRDCIGSRVDSNGAYTPDRDKTLYAKWKDATPPAKPVLQSGVTLPTGWTNTQTTIPLTLYDNEGVTKLKVSVDGNSDTEVNGFSGAIGSMTYDYPSVQEGEHTYRFIAIDAAGNTSDASDPFTIKLDKTKPEIGELIYENKAKNFLDWIIGKKSMIIHVSVTDAGSGVEKISYTMTPRDAAGNLDSNSAETKTAAVTDSEAKITFDRDFRGTITINCADRVGNAADSKTIGTVGAGGVIVEDTPPDITILADRNISDTQQIQPGGVDVSEGYYNSAPALLVTVKDDTGNAITAGIDTVKYKVGDGTEQSAVVNTNALQEEVAFTIPASEIPPGITEITVTATDNAGNTATKPITVKVKGPEKTPAAVIDYQDEKLTGLVPGGSHTIDGTAYTADGEGRIPIIEGWFGKSVSIIKKGNGSETTDSPAQSLLIPARPARPTPAGVDVSTAGGTGKLTDLTAGTAYEISTDGGKTWASHAADESGQITGLAPGVYVVRVKAGVSNFASEPGDSVKIGAYQVKVTFMVDGQKYREIAVDYGTALTDIPPVPAKENAISAWCMDGQGTTPATFTNITADMTVYAVYTTTYTVTLQTGTGYTLSAQGDSESPVKEGGSFAFTFALAKGYQTTKAFVVKVNGVQVELTAQEPYTYTITDIRENKTVTVEGVAKKPGGKPSDDGDKGDDPNPESDDPSSKSDDTNPENPSPKPPVTPPAKTTSPAPAPGETPPAEKQPEGRPKTTPEREENGAQNESGEPEKERKPKDTDAENAGIDGTDARSKAADSTGSGQPAEGTPVRQAEVKIGDGTVIVTVVCEEEKCAAAVSDTEKVVEAVLTPDQQELVNGGETIEIRIDVTDISEKVPAQDKEVIESGIGVYREEVPGLVLGMYVDISMFIKLGAGDWNAITETDEPIEVVVNIPEKLLSDNRKFIIIRSHNGEYTFMNDLDDAPETITVSTDRFSSYAIAYAETDGTGADNGAKCGLCHICPTFLGICYFIWLAFIIAAIAIVVFAVLHRKKEDEPEERKG